MPNKALDALRIPHHLSKRDKLTDGQKIEIRQRVQSGESKHSLAKEYGVSRRTIQFAADPEAYERALAMRRERWRTSYSDGRYHDPDTHATRMRDLRARKKEALSDA